ncbi:MAG: hypothetical protein EXX96DRAFT_581455, partial [Benjaminiella poitrasii]
MTTSTSTSTSLFALTSAAVVTFLFASAQSSSYPNNFLSLFPPFLFLFAFLFI